MPTLACVAACWRDDLAAAAQPRGTARQPKRRRGNPALSLLLRGCLMGETKAKDLMAECRRVLCCWYECVAQASLRSQFGRMQPHPNKSLPNWLEWLLIIQLESLRLAPSDGCRLSDKGGNTYWIHASLTIEVNPQWQHDRIAPTERY